MIQNLAKKIGYFMICFGMPEENYKIYVYSIECLLNLFISDILLILLGIFTHHLIEIIIWDISFMPLRRQIGGYHANSHFGCICASIFIGGICLICNHFWSSFPIVGYLCLLFLFPVIVKLTPVLHPNHPVTKKQIQRAHQTGIFLFLLETVISFLFLFFYPFCTWCIISGIFSASVLCIVGYFKNSIT